jgi:hypothetical protein
VEKSPAKRTLSLAVFFAPSAIGYARHFDRSEARPLAFFTVFVLRTKAFAFRSSFFSASGDAPLPPVIA